MAFTHEKVETNNALMIVLILLVLAVAGMVEGDADAGTGARPGLLLPRSQLLAISGMAC